MKQAWLCTVYFSFKLYSLGEIVTPNSARSHLVAAYITADNNKLSMVFSARFFFCFEKRK